MICVNYLGEKESLGICFLGQGTLFASKEKESVFLRNKKGKHFPEVRKTLSGPKALFFPLTGIEFPLTDFPYAYQTWESEENGFQENEFLETNKA